MTCGPTFEELLTEAATAPVEGWDFSWLAGRATEARPSWGYAGLVARRMATVDAALDIQTGGGEVLATIQSPPKLLAATESWPPNVEIARRNLRPIGDAVYEVADDADLPFPDRSFELVVSRHPVLVGWPEIARVLQPGGCYLSQQVGAGSVRELTDAVMGPQPVSQKRSPENAVAAAKAAGLTVVDLRVESLPMAFYDIGAVVYFLRKAIWIVPGFTVAAYHEPLRRLHDTIAARGPFPATSERFLIEARRQAG